VPSPGQSPIVVFSLVPKSENGDFFFAQDAKERDIASLAERDHQFVVERIVAHPSASERIAFKDLEFGQDRINRPKGQVEISRLHGRALEKFFQALQIILRFSGKQDPVSHSALPVLFCFKDSILARSLLRISPRTSEAG